MDQEQAPLALFWKEALDRIRAEISDQEYVTWFNRIQFDSSGEHEIVFAIPSRFIQDQISQRYLPLIKETLSELTGSDISVRFVIRRILQDPDLAKQQEGQASSSLPEEDEKDIPRQAAPKRKHKHSLMNTDYNENYSFDSFVVGDNSSFAFNACMAIAKNPGTTYNPCLIYGGVGLGKTHLVQSIGNYISKNTPELKVAYVTAETFTNEFIQSIGDRKSQHFKNIYRKVDILLIDDIHFLQGKNSTQEELFHTFNDLYDSNKQMVFTCDRPVSELKELTARLRSRFERGLNVDLQPPDFETRMAILRKKCGEQHFHMADDVLSFISKNINTNVRDLEASLTKLIAYSKLLNKEITLSIAQEQLKDSYSLNREQGIAIETIQRVVSDYFNLSYFELRGKKRTRTVALPRQIAMYIARKMTDYSTTEIGYEFGGRDHTTVMHACQRIESLLQNDTSMDGVIQKLVRSVNEYRRSS